MRRLKQSSDVISICLNPKWLPSGRQTPLLSPLITDVVCCITIMASQRGRCPQNIISVMHNVFSTSICIFVIFKSLCTSLGWWVCCNGSPAGHLTSVCLYYFSVVWSKMAPLPYGIWHFWAPPHAPQQSGGSLQWRGNLRGWQQAACSGTTPAVCVTVTPASCVKLG